MFDDDFFKESERLQQQASSMLKKGIKWYLATILTVMLFLAALVVGVFWAVKKISTEDHADPLPRASDSSDAPALQR